MDATYLARLEWEILTVYLQIPPEAFPPNAYWLLGLTPEMSDPATVRWAGQQRITYLRSIPDPILQPAVPYVVARVESAMACLAVPAAPVAAPNYYQPAVPADAEPCAPPVLVLPAKTASQPSVVPLPDETASEASSETSSETQRSNVLRRIWSFFQLQPDSADPHSQRLIRIAAVLGGGTVTLLLLLMMTTRLLNSMKQPPITTTTQLATNVAAARPAVSTTAKSSAKPKPVAVIPPSAPTPVSAPPATAPPPSAAPATVPEAQATPLEAPSPAAPRPLPLPVVDLPAAVELPALVARGEGQALFPWQPGEVSLALDSGASQIAWELKRLPDADGQAVWSVLPAMDPMRELIAAEQPIGFFTVTDEAVSFRWADEARSPTFDQLRNCILELTSGDQKHRVALRVPQTLTPLSITLLERREKIELSAVDWPRSEALFLEVFHCTGFTAPPLIKPDDHRVAGKTRGAIVLPGWTRAEINFGLLGSGDTQVVVFESVFYLNNGQTELTHTRVQQSLQNLQSNLAKEKQTLTNYQQRLDAATDEADRVRGTAPPGGVNPQAFVLLRSKQLAQLGEEVVKCNSGMQRLQSEIPRTEATIANVERLIPKLDEWTRGTKIHWRIGANTTRGEMTLVTTQP